MATPVSTKKGNMTRVVGYILSALMILTWLLFFFGLNEYLQPTNSDSPLRMLNIAWPGWVFMVALALTPIVFYVLRSFDRVMYGAVEIFIGILTAYLTMFPNGYIPNLDQPYYNLLPDASSGLKLAAAIYVVIRGLDNVDQGRQRRGQKTLKEWLLSPAVEEMGNRSVFRSALEARAILLAWRSEVRAKRLAQQKTTKSQTPDNK